MNQSQYAGMQNAAAAKSLSPEPQSEVDRELSAAKNGLEMLLAQIDSLSQRLRTVSAEPAKLDGTASPAPACYSALGGELQTLSHRLLYAQSRVGEIASCLCI